MERRFSPPVSEGEELDVKIEAVGEKGDGIARKDGFVLFIPGVKEGDEVHIKVTRVLKKVGFAEVVGQSEGKTEEPEQPQETEEEKKEEPSEETKEEVQAEDTEDFGEELENK